MATETTSRLQGLEERDLGEPAAANIAEATGYDELLAAASQVLDDPVALDARAPSFVLHAPLELLARAALRDLQTLNRSDRITRERLVSLAVRYNHAGPKVPTPLQHDYADQDAAATALRSAGVGDISSADLATVWLVEHSDTAQLCRILAPLCVLRTGAAAHVNIYTHLLDTPRSASNAPMLRGLVRELCKEPQAIIQPWEPRTGELSVTDAFRLRSSCPGASAVVVGASVGPDPATPPHPFSDPLRRSDPP